MAKLHEVTLQGDGDEVLIHLADGRRVIVEPNLYVEDEVIVELRSESGMFDSRHYVSFRFGQEDT